MRKKIQFTIAALMASLLTACACSSATNVAPTIAPTAVVAPNVTEAPTVEPTVEPMEVPTEVPTPEPTVEPTAEPTVEPTMEPTEVPTEAPTEAPTVEPTPVPTEFPTETPMVEPTVEPTEAPTATPVPTSTPTPKPTATPKPTKAPTPKPTATPKPTKAPEKTVTNKVTVIFTDGSQKSYSVTETIDLGGKKAKTVYFGNYPQNRVAEADLTDDIINAKYDEYGEAEVNGVKYRRLAKSDFVKDPDTPFPLYYYKGIYCSLSPHFDTDYAYFKYSPIEWDVYDNEDGRLFLVSAKVIDYVFYNLSGQELIKAYKDFGGEAVEDFKNFRYAVHYDNSSLRAWLNGYDGSGVWGGDSFTEKNSSFISCAFSKEEQAVILPYLLKTEEFMCEMNRNNKVRIVQAAGPDITDKIYPLSAKELADPKYGFPADGKQVEYKTKRYKCGTATDFVCAIGGRDWGECDHWTRSWNKRLPAYENEDDWKQEFGPTICSALGQLLGDVIDTNGKDLTANGIVPALRLKVKN